VLDIRPTAELWSYFHELRQLNYISIRQDQLLRSLLLKSFISAVHAEVVFDLLSPAMTTSLPCRTLP
jgi:hypothetical protein